MILKLFLLLFFVNGITAEGEPCKRHDQSDGTCTPYRSCPALFSLDSRAKAEPKLKALMKKNVCETTSSKVMVCCPNQENYCVNPNVEEGTCTTLSQCPRLNELHIDSSQTPENVEFQEKSKCGPDDGKTRVCCAPDDKAYMNTNTRRRILEKLKSPLIPKPNDCGYMQLEDFIVGGNKTAFNEFLWTVSLKYKNLEENKFVYACGGSLINDRYVLTAAHCIEGLPRHLEFVDVRIGEYNFDTPIDCDPNNRWDCLPAPFNIEVSEKIAHPEYNSRSSNTHNDIALLRLARKVEFTDYLKPICLPLDPDTWTTDFRDKSFIVAGWGKTETRFRSSIKMKVEVPALPSETCASVFGKSSREIVGSQICAGGEDGKDSCNGDSGGPLMRQNIEKSTLEWYLAGIVSYGPVNCGSKGAPGVYTRVASFLEWIVDNMKP